MKCITFLDKLYHLYMFTVCAHIHPYPSAYIHPNLDERVDVDGPSETTDSTEWIHGSTGWIRS